MSLPHCLHTPFLGTSFAWSPFAFVTLSPSLHDWCGTRIISDSWMSSSIVVSGSDAFYQLINFFIWTQNLNTKSDHKKLLQKIITKLFFFQIWTQNLYTKSKSKILYLTFKYKILLLKLFFFTTLEIKTFIFIFHIAFLSYSLFFRLVFFWTFYQIM